VTLERWGSRPQQVLAILRRGFAKNVADRVPAFLGERLALLPLVARIVGLP
jgi:hypothetical protein